ncbi:50S ribosomal protein L29 [Wenzhouxiangella sp. AB-CW3]|uniref:50S ribosomal protein L29 n=1 Tax=Wenzhouxiangella sp. AB-CW3 TaxID=2771012 RepID=UPI00168BC8BE|nr:50S ribosomal protein L29 [Wenzhouxiangella sp. AB-CW3]QOC23383.1 50S ribosomal protein L29 [Wenzhouxiangella sp. AB-CW3]
MKASELQAKNPSELDEMLLDLRKEQFTLRMQHGTGQLGSPHELRRVRKDIARVKTVLNQKQEDKA